MAIKRRASRGSSPEPGARVPVCVPKQLPRSKWVAAAEMALALNPANHPNSAATAMAVAMGTGSHRERLAVAVGKRWPATGVRLTVGFLDNPPADLRTRILLHMNAWSKSANVLFVEASTDPEVRIARADSPPDDAGYWSYVGTDIRHISRKKPTMNLEAFTMRTPESEYKRVVRHETGHTLGFPHEHMRRQLVARIDRAKAIKSFFESDGWSPAQVEAQVLTPLEESTILGTTRADQHSIMCYEIPGDITKNGKPIIGGVDITPRDFKFAASLYPKSAAPTP